MEENTVKAMFTQPNIVHTPKVKGIFKIAVQPIKHLNFIITPTGKCSLERI